MPIPRYGEARRKAAGQAYAMWVRRLTMEEIAEHFDSTRQTVSKVIKEERERLRDIAGEDEALKAKEKAIATYDAVIRSSWQRLARLKDTSLNVSGLHNNIISAQSHIDVITGVESPLQIEETRRITIEQVDQLLHGAISVN